MFFKRKVIENTQVAVKTTAEIDQLKQMEQSFMKRVERLEHTIQNVVNTEQHTVLMNIEVVNNDLYHEQTVCYISSATSHSFSQQIKFSQLEQMMNDQ